MSGRYVHCPKKDFPDTNHGAQAMPVSSRRPHLPARLVLIAEQAGGEWEQYVPLCNHRNRFHAGAWSTGLGFLYLCLFWLIPRRQMEQSLLCREFHGIIQHQCKDCPEDSSPIMNQTRFLIVSDVGVSAIECNEERVVKKILAVNGQSLLTDLTCYRQHLFHANG